MNDLHRVELKAGSDFRGRTCVIDGRDITSMLHGVRVNVDGSSLPQVILELNRPDVDLDIEGHVSVLTNLDPKLVLFDFLAGVEPQWLEEKILENHDMSETTGQAVLRVLREHAGV